MDTDVEFFIRNHEASLSEPERSHFVGALVRLANELVAEYVADYEAAVAAHRAGIEQLRADDIAAAWQAN